MALVPAPTCDFRVCFQLVPGEEHYSERSKSTDEFLAQKTEASSRVATRKGLDMPGKLPSSKITNLVTTVDTEIVHTAKGPMVWGTVDICYSSEGLKPRITITVPVPVLEAHSDTQRRSEALRRARKLIDHACVAIEPEPEPQGVSEVLNGLAQELGVMPPAVSPKHVRSV